MHIASKTKSPAVRLLPLLLAIITQLILAGPANSAALYKWVDENGQIRYSDRLPAQQSKKKHQQLNSQGVVLSTKEAAKSDEELAAEAEAKRKQQEDDAVQAKLKEAQDKKDKVLLLTFSNEAELGFARDDRIEVLDSVIKLINKSILSTQEKLEQLKTHADLTFVSQGKEIPGGLAQKIEHFARKMESRSAQLDLKVLEKEKINEQYELDLNRFRDLKAQAN